MPAAKREFRGTRRHFGRWQASVYFPAGMVVRRVIGNRFAEGVAMAAQVNRSAGNVSSARRRARLPSETPAFGVVEQLEPRGMLSGIGVAVMPPDVADSPVVVAPPAAITATGLRVMLPPSVRSGIPVTAVIAAVDATGRPVFTANGQVALSSSDANASLPATVTLANGRAIVPVTFNTAGPQTLTATDVLDAMRAVTASTRVSTPPVAEALRIIMPPLVQAGVPTTVTALAVDAAGRPAVSFNGSATVASSDPAASLPLIEVVFRNGRATFRVSMSTAGRQSVTVTSLGDARVSGTARTMVAAQQTVASFLVALPPRVVAGTPVTIAIVALDAARRPVTGYSGNATLASSDPAATLPSSVTFRDGRASARITLTTAGSQSLSVRGGAAGDVVSTVTTTVIAAPVVVRFAVALPKAVPAAVPVTAMLVPLDAQGRPVPTYSGTASLSSTDSAARLPATVTFVNGRAMVRVVFSTIGEQTLSATSGDIVGSGTTQVGQVTILPVA